MVSNKKWFVIGFLVIFTLGFGCGKWFTQWQYATRQEQVMLLEPDTVSIEGQEATAPKVIMVHVAGAVQSPGLYALEEGDRVDDALKLAVVSPEANVDGQLNRAAVLVDGQKIIVPSLGDDEGDGAVSQTVLSDNSPEGLVNINQASATELVNLPGIGEVKAKAIVDYRTSHGPFKSIEELQQVKGIGSKTFESLRSQITI